MCWRTKLGKVGSVADERNGEAYRKKKKRKKLAKTLEPRYFRLVSCTGNFSHRLYFAVGNWCMGIEDARGTNRREKIHWGKSAGVEKICRITE